MRMRRMIAGMTAMALLAGCYGTVRDGQVGEPGEDYSGAADIVEAGVDYRTDTTRLFIRLGRFSSPQVIYYNKQWAISTDGDTTGDLRLAIGSFTQGGDPDVWRLLQAGPSPYPQPAICTGRTVYGGFDGDDTFSITFPTSCLATNRVLPDTVRIQAEVDADRSGGDATDWTAQVVRD